MLCKAIISRLLGQRKIVPLQVGNLPDIDRTSLAVKYHANIRETYFCFLIYRNTKLKLPVLTVRCKLR